MRENLPNTKEFESLYKYVGDVNARVEGNKSSTDEIKAVMQEFNKKAKDFYTTLSKQSASDFNEKLIEVEQAADSAKRAAKKSSDINESLKQQIIDAHDKICEFKKRYIH